MHAILVRLSLIELKMDKGSRGTLEYEAEGEGIKSKLLTSFSIWLAKLYFDSVFFMLSHLGCQTYYQYSIIVLSVQ